MKVFSTEPFSLCHKQRKSFALASSRCPCRQADRLATRRRTPCRRQTRTHRVRAFCRTPTLPRSAPSCPCGGTCPCRGAGAAGTPPRTCSPGTAACPDRETVRARTPPHRPSSCCGRGRTRRRALCSTPTRRRCRTWVRCTHQGRAWRRGATAPRSGAHQGWSAPRCLPAGRAATAPRTLPPYGWSTHPCRGTPLPPTPRGRRRRSRTRTHRSHGTRRRAVYRGRHRSARRGARRCPRVFHQQTHLRTPTRRRPPGARRGQTCGPGASDRRTRSDCRQTETFRCPASDPGTTHRRTSPRRTRLCAFPFPRGRPCAAAQSGWPGTPALPRRRC
eukprot:PhM_4_TR10783/c0_g1_i1/m.101484